MNKRKATPSIEDRCELFGRHGGDMPDREELLQWSLESTALDAASAWLCPH